MVTINQNVSGRCSGGKWQNHKSTIYQSMMTDSNKWLITLNVLQVFLIRKTCVVKENCSRFVFTGFVICIKIFIIQTIAINCLESSSIPRLIWILWTVYYTSYTMYTTHTIVNGKIIHFFPTSWSFHSKIYCLQINL